MYRRLVTGTSGTMVANHTLNEIQLKFDARNKDARVFKFDYVAQGDTVNRDFFKNCGVKRMVRQVVKGYHSTIFAYGQTGAGKSYTMEGYKYQINEKGKYEPQIDQCVKDDNLGIVQRCSQYLLSTISKFKSNRKISVTVSFLQLYNERIYDLLNREMFKNKKTKMVFNQLRSNP